MVTSRIHLACVVASVEIHSTSLLPGPRSSELAIALSAFSYALSVASPADLDSSMMRSLSLRTRCATASTRASAALAAWLAPALADCAARAELDRAERALDERVERARLAVLPPLRLAVLRALLLRELLLRPLPLLLREPLERLPLEREDWLRPDEPPELEPLLLA